MSELSKQQQLTVEMLPQIVARAGGGAEALALLIEMIASLAEISANRRAVEVAALKTLRERFAWSDEGGRA